MPAPVAASPDDIEITSVSGALRRSLPKIVLMSALLGGLTYGTLMMVAPKFQSQAEMAIVARGASLNDGKGNNAPDSLAIKVDKEAINTHVRVLQSPDLLSKIAADLKLNEKKEFNSALGPVDLLDTLQRMLGLGGPRPGESERDRVLNALRNQLEVYSAKESRFIGIRVTSADPELAAAIANNLVDVYRNQLASQTITEVDDQQKVLQAKIEKLTPEVAAAETEAERYRGEINAFRGANQNTGLNEQQLTELTAELTKAKAARGEAEARAKSARDMMKTGSAEALPDVQKSPLIQNLVQQRVRVERQISELSATLLPGHPRMRQLQGDLAGLKIQLAGEVGKLVDSLDKEAKVAQGREDSIKKSLDELKSKVVSNAPEEARLRQLEASAKAKRTELESLQSQLEANRKKLDARAQPVDAQLISTAQAASVPIFPKKGANAAIVSLATFMLGAMLSIWRALFDGARSGGALPAQRKTRSGAEALHAEPMLAGAPKARELQTVKERAEDIVVENERVRSVSALAKRLENRAPAHGGLRCLMSGETAYVDAAPEAIELAKTLADDGSQVILVNWSPSGRGIASEVGTGGGKGLSELLAGEISFEDAVKRVPSSTAHFISCGGAMAALTAGEDPDPDQVNLVLDALDEAYDKIIVVGAHEEARALFEMIEGRFDAGILVTGEKKLSKVLQDPPDAFLGFEVADIDIIRLERTAPQPASSQKLIMRGASKPGAEVRSV